MDKEEDYYRKNGQDVCEELGTSPEEGISEDQVEERREKYGPNRIKMREPPSWLSLFLDHLTEFVSILLIVVGIVALATYFLGHGGGLERLAESVIIYFIVVINASVGAHQEHKSEQTAQRLREMVKTECTVKRKGEFEEIDSEDLVPGDLVFLESGDKVPADLRLLDAEDLEIQESVLTGESKTVAKKTERIEEDRPLAERNNMAYMNTHVTRGNGKGVVVATGADTEAGAIAEASKGEEQEMPFVQEVSDTGRTISKLALALVAVASLVFMLYGKSLYQIFMLAAALIIGSIPAALPVTVTYSLTNASKKMAEHSALIKNLPMIETLGGVDVICTDKTGTLTKNEMAVKKFYIAGESTLEAEDIDRKRHEEIIRCALTANEAQEAKGEEGYIGSPEDVGLLDFLESNVSDASKMKEKYEEVDFLPFSSERKMAQSLVRFDERKVRYTKGAPEAIIDRCDRIWVDGEIEEFTEDRKEEVKNAVEQFSEEALRNLAFSYKEVEREGVGVDTGGDVFLGAVGMWDPPKEGVKEAIQTCYDAGIEIKMITGDSRETAEAIAEVCGMENISTVTWGEVKDASDEEMEEIVQENNVFARMDPELKMRMVEALHRLDEQVAITGDGVNDTPPMKAAEVGVAMGDRGSDITRDVADIILLDDNFASITEAVKYGRTALSNVKKVANYLLTANLFEVVVLFISAFMGFAPFVALQLLWVNFATDIFPAIGLGGDPPRPNIMEKLPTGKEEKILTKRIWYLLAGIGFKKVVMVFLAFFAVLWFSSGDFTALGITGNLTMAQTSAFVWLGLSHIVRIVAIRWEEGWKGKDIFINKTVNYSLLWPLVSFLIILYTPLAGFFDAVSLPLWAWGVLSISIGVSVILAIIIAKGVHKILGGYGEREY